AWSDIPLMFAAQIVIVWIFHRTGGSVLAIMLLHWMNNTFTGEFVGPLFAGADATRYSWLLVALWGALAFGVLLVAGPRLGLRPDPTGTSRPTERVGIA
ncbi:MAG: hypothetical protein HGA45_31070, partial [Chloroflexales bacterium]|nr:hypothetical protein [Chloroflexales bacterium]